MKKPVPESVMLASPRLDLDDRRLRFLEEGVHFLAHRLENVAGSTDGE